MFDAAAADPSRRSVDEGVTGLEAFVPFDRRLALARSEALPDRTSGAALFADVSGFSALTEDLLGRFGPQRGAEELARRVDAVLADVIIEVRRYGGSVIGFAGDAVTAWFDGDDGRRAVAAALATQRRSAGGGPGDGRLAVKLGTTAGLARRFLVGHPRIQRIDVVAGAIVDRMAVAEELGRPGEVLVGSEIVGWIQDRIEIVEWRQDRSAHSPADGPAQREGEWFAVIEGSPEGLADPAEPEAGPRLPSDISRDWVIPAVYQRLLRGRGEVVPEIRSVVTLFCRFGGIAYDLDNRAETKLDRYIRWAQTVLARYEAFLFQLVVGDKGSYFYGAFGAPLAHEDDHLRAVRAAAELVEDPGDMGFLPESRVGIGYGKLLAGAHGSPLRRTYGALGQAANRGARLMQAALPGQVLVDASVAEAAASHYLFSPTASPGSAELVSERFTPQVLEPRRRTSPVTIGRSEEQERLRRSLHRLLDGEPEVTILEGPAGIGKSRLLSDFRQEAESLGIPVYVGAGNGVEQNTPFYAWRSVFREILGVDDSSGPEGVRAAVERHLVDEPHLIQLAPLLNPVLPVDLPDTPLTSQMPPSVRSDNALDVLIACLNRPSAALSVAVVILDDAQWLDSASWTLVERVQSATSSISVLVATRVFDPLGSESGFVTRLVKEAPEARIRLGPLSREETESLAVRYLGTSTVPHQLSEVLMERAEGNPFFVEALLDTLLEREIIRVAHGRLDLIGRLDELRTELPADVERLLISRLDRLPLGQQTVLLVASILGRRFTYGMLRDIAPDEMGLSEMSEELQDLVELDLLTVEEEVPERTFGFRHGLVRQAAAELLPPSWKRSIHHRTAEWIEEHHPDGLVPWYSVLAHHWDAAGNVEKALHYLDLAAAHAYATSAYEEAVALYRRATELAEHQDGDSFQLARRHLRLGEVYVHRQEEDVTLGRDHLERGLAILGMAPRGVWRLPGVLVQLVIHLWRGMVLSGRSRSRAEPEQLLEASRAYERLVEVYYISGENLLSLYAALRALNLAERVGPSAELARGLATVGAMLGFIPFRRAAERYLMRALGMVDQDTDPAATAWTSLVAAFYQAGVGSWVGDGSMPGAEVLVRQVIDLSDTIGDSRRLEDGLSNLMIQMYLRGELGEGLHLSDRLLEMAEVRAATRPRAYGLQGRSYCLLDAGRVAEARSSIVELDDLLAADLRFADRALVDDVAGLMATVEARAGRIPRAAQYADSLLNRLAGRLPSNFSSLAAYSAPAEVLLTDWRVRGETKDLRRATRRSLRVLRRYARVFPVGAPRLLLWQGVEASLKGRPGTAARLLRASAQRAADLGLRVDEVRAWTELAELLGPDSQEGAEAGRRAEQLLGSDVVGEVA